MDQTTISLCPYLGSWRDPATAYNYPTGANVCTIGPKASDVDKAHQAAFCLTSRFSACFLFQSQPTIGPEASSK